MAGPRLLDSERMSLSDLYSEVLYTTMRLHHAPEAKALVAAADKQLGEVERVVGVDLTLQTKLVDGEVQVDWRNYDLDAWLGYFRGVLGTKRGGRPGQTLFDRFFHDKTPSEVIRMALRPELQVVTPWVASLKAETDAELKKQGSELEALVTAGADAVAAEDAATQAVRDFRAGQRLQLFDDINAWRQSLHGELSTLGKPREWAQSFFRPGRRRRVMPELTLLQAQSVVAALRAELTEAEADLDAVKKRDEAEALKNAEKQQRMQALEEARQQGAALKQRIAELEAQLAS